MKGITVMVLMILFTLNLVGAGFLDGGFDGDDGNNFVDGTSLTPKLTFGFFCSRLTETDDVDCIAGVFENDGGFVHESDGSLVEYDTCHALDTTMYMDSNMRIRDNACELSRIDGTTPVSTDNPATRTFYTQMSGIDTAVTTTQDCGIVVRNGIVYMTVRCQRNSGIDSDFDGIVLLGYTVSSILTRTLTTAEFLVNFQAIIEVKRFWDVTFDVYHTIDKSLPLASKTVTGGNFEDVSGTTLPLGSSVYFEVCLDIPDTSGQSGDFYFPMNANSPIGLRMHSCSVSYTYATDGGDGDITGSGFGIIDSVGCSDGQPPFFSEYTNEYVLLYAQDGNAATLNDYLRAPNCQRTKVTEVAVPARKTAGNVLITFHCFIDYCETRDAECFWDDGSGLAQPTCGAGRRRRQSGSDDYPSDWPREVSTSFTVRTEPKDVEIITEVQPSERKECFEKKTFFAISIALGILLLIVFAIALVLFVKVRTAQFDESSSAEGFHNKAYN